MLEELKNAAINNNLNGVKDAIKNGADVNAKDSDGCTALMLSAQQGLLGVVELLVEKGANLRAKSNSHSDLSDGICIYGWTALMLAIESNQSDVAKLLIEAGASIDITDAEMSELARWLKLGASLESSVIVVDKLLTGEKFGRLEIDSDLVMKRLANIMLIKLKDHENFQSIQFSIDQVENRIRASEYLQGKNDIILQHVKKHV